MPPLKVLHVLTHSNVTRGGAIQALLLARGQKAAGHTVQVVANARLRRPLDPTFQPWIAEGIPISIFDMGTFGFEHPFEVRRFRAFLRDLAPDVVHVHRDTALVFTWLATLLRPLPAFVSQRGTTHAFRTLISSRAHKSRRVHRVIAVADAVKRALVSYGLSEAKVEVVYGSFDVDRFDPARADGGRVRRELRLAPEQKLIVQVGELHKKKGPKHFVRMAALLARERPDCVFALVGKGRQRRRIRKLIKRLGVGDHVRMLGFRRDVADVYAAADVAVNSSIRDEGLTGALREALAMARPVVATRTDGNPEIVRHGETGLVVEPLDEVAMARAIGEVLDHPERGRAMGQAGRKLVLELMSPDVRLARTEAVYREALREDEARRRSEGRET